MLYISKIGDYLKILTNDEVKDFVVINFSKYFKSTGTKLCRTNSDEVEKHAKIMQSNFSDKYVHG